MKKAILLSLFISCSVQAQITYETRVYQEPRLHNVVPNPFPPSYYQAKMRSYNFQNRPRIIISTPVQVTIPTGSISPQDQQIINLIR